MSANSKLLKIARAIRKNKEQPASVRTARAPLPTKLNGLYFVLECADKEDFMLRVQSDIRPGEWVSYGVNEDEIRKILADFKLDEIPRIVSAAKYNRSIQVIPNHGTAVPPQVISLYPPTPAPGLDWQDGEDNQPVHGLTDW